MNRFYCSVSDVRQDKIIISDSGQVHHIKDVLRFEIGEKAAIFDNEGNVYTARLENISEKKAEFRVEAKKLKVDSKRAVITVACAIPKKDKIDDIIDKLTQLGVDRIIPLISERVIVRMDKAKEVQRWKRWEKIALSACKQSQRDSVPVVEPVTDFAELTGRSREFDLKLIPNLLGERKSLKECLSGKKVGSVLALIGPEGDFTPEEINSAVKSGFIPVSFGDLVFRVETAAVYIASILQYELNT